MKNSIYWIIFHWAIVLFSSRNHKLYESHVCTLHTKPVYTHFNIKVVAIHIRAQFLIQAEEVKNGCFQNAMDMICKHFNSKYNQTFISGSVCQMDLPLPSFKSTMTSFIWQFHLCFTIYLLLSHPLWSYAYRLSWEYSLFGWITLLR